MTTKRERAEELKAHHETDAESDDFKIKLSELRFHLDDLINFMDSTSDHEARSYYSHFRDFREIVTHKNQISKYN